MRLEQINELRKRMEFNSTESETLVRLVEESQQKGESFQKENKRLRILSQKLLKKIGREQIFFTDADLPSNFDPKTCCSVGIDGSFFPMGGIGGKWYIPYSVVRILFSEGFHSMPVVDVYAAGIEEIQEQEFINVKSEASLRMLVGESKAIENWGAKNIPSLIFIDGPIVDPPKPVNDDYVIERTKGIKKCLEKSIMIGCVKRSRDNFFKKDFEEKFKIDFSELNNFPSDQYLFAYFFMSYRHETDYNGSLFSHFIDISNMPPNEKYNENGLKIFTVYFQKNINSKVMRIDIPFLAGREKNLLAIEKTIKKAIKSVNDWQYPDQYVPLPVELAHQKCNMKKLLHEVEVLTLLIKLH